VDFVPLLAFSGTVASSTTRVTDSDGNVAKSTITITVTAVIPVALPDNASTPYSHAVTIPVLAIDHAGDPVAPLVPASVHLVDPISGTSRPVVIVPNQGTYAVDSATGEITFTPVPWFSGAAAPITYLVADSDGNLASSWVSVHVTAVFPNIVADSASTPFQTPATIPVLANDTPGDASAPLDPLSVVLEDPADGSWQTTVTVLGQGTLAVQLDGQVLFTPVPARQGTVDPVLYRVTDANGTHRTAAINVVIGNAPVAAADTATTLQGKPVTLALLGNDHPGTGGTLRPETTQLLDPADSAGRADTPLDASTVQLQDPATGTWGKAVTSTAVGTWTVKANGSVEFTPTTTYVGVTAPVSYQVADVNSTYAQATLDVTVDAPYGAKAGSDSAIGSGTGAVTLHPLANDTPSHGATWVVSRGGGRQHRGGHCHDASEHGRTHPPGGWDRRPPAAHGRCRTAHRPPAPRRPGLAASGAGAATSAVAGRCRPPTRVRGVLTHVVWDWNGTLFDDLHCCVAVANQLLEEFGLPGLTGVADYHAKFRFPIIDYYADLGFDTSTVGNFQAAALRYMALYGEASAGCRLHEGAADALAAVHAAGVRQVLISASQQDNLRVQVAPFGLEPLLDGIHGIDDIYAASKESIACRWLHDEGLEGDSVLFVGDSEHDFEIAEAVGAHCVLFSGGHHARAHLESLGAPVIDDLRDVPRLAARL